MDISTSRTNIIIWVILALVVGLLIGYGFGRQMGGAGDMVTSTDMTSTSTAATTTSKASGLLGSGVKPVTGIVAQGNSVSVVDQPAGMSVTVKSAMLSQEAWVAIRDSSGATLGAALFPAGAHTDVSVPLLSPTQAGQNYQALIYFDDGTKTFNLHTETIVLNPDGSVAGTTFDAQ
jgi:hypothetical protein